MLPLPALLLSALLAATPAPATEARIVFRTGMTMTVRSYRVEGRSVHLVSLEGEPQILRADTVDLPRTERATAAHRATLAQRAALAAAAEEAHADRVAAVRTANETHRSRSSGRRGMTIGTGDKAVILEDAVYESSDQKRDRLATELARADRTLLVFQSEQCPDCRRVATDVLTAPVVTRALDGYEVRTLDLVQDDSLARKHGVRRAPAFVVLDAEGRTLRACSGFQPADTLAAWLAR